MKTHEVEDMLGITKQALIYYEKEGLIPAVPRDKNGIRDFDENSCGWIEFIKCMRSAGLEIETLKRSHLKRNIIIGVVAVLIISAIILNFTRAKYRVTESIPLVNGTINFSMKTSHHITNNF